MNPHSLLLTLFKTAAGYEEGVMALCLRRKKIKLKLDFYAT